MENRTTTLEKLIEKIEIYVKTTFDLFGCNLVYKSADIISVIAAKLSIATVVVLSFLFASIGLALWIGEQLEKIYYGFFIVAGAYVLLACILSILKNIWIKRPISNFIIKQTLKKN